MDWKISWDKSELYCDNKSTISTIHNLVQQDRTKHTVVERQFIKEKLDNDLICTLCVHSKPICG